MINTYLTVHYRDKGSDSSSFILINDMSIRLATGSVRKSNDYVPTQNTSTIYLEKGTNINFENYIWNGHSAYHSTIFAVYALFN